MVRTVKMARAARMVRTAMVAPAVSVQAEERSEEASVQVFPHLSATLDSLLAVKAAAEVLKAAAKPVQTAVLFFSETQVSKQHGSTHLENRFSQPHSEYH